MHDIYSLNTSRTVEMSDDRELLYFWAIGDLHFRTNEYWNAIHKQRIQSMFQDLLTLWQEESVPAFCVSPGDLVEAGTPANYALAKTQIMAQLQDIPFYPGIGNHEFYPDEGETMAHTPEEFTKVWNKPTRYFWIVNGVLCIMLDQPNPFVPNPAIENPVYFSEDSLAFLKQTLQEYPHHLAIVFAHCPLHNTVLDRDPVQNLDFDSEETFFHVENSDEVRAILADYPNVGLYIYGHTHSGWGAPNIIYTEHPCDHPITHINLMSPWYTGRRRGAIKNLTTFRWEYRPDEPNIQTSFGFHIYRNRAIIHIREHLTQRWLAEYTVPLRPDFH